MTIEEFWNNAFLAALGRLPVVEAKKEADLATKTCIEHWHRNWENRSPENAPRVQKVDIASVFLPIDSQGKIIPGMFALRES